MIKEEYAKLLKQAERDFEDNMKFVMVLKKVKAKALDREFNMFHDKAFEEINCLECGNCCRSVTPIYQQKDIIQLSKRFGCRPIVWEKEFTLVDEDNDRIAKTVPCPFIADDNYCIYYEDRPKFCRDYPYTDKTRLRYYLRETMENSKICPAVYLMVKWVKESVNTGMIS